MKRSIIHAILFIIFVLVGISLVIPSAAATANPTNTPKPTKTPKPTIVPKPTTDMTAVRLAHARSVALKQIDNRVNGYSDESDNGRSISHHPGIKTLTNTLNKNQSKYLTSDLTDLTAQLNGMGSQLDTWRTAINAAPTVDEIKSIQISQLLKTDFYVVFVPQYHLYIKLAVINKSLAQINLRLTNYQADFSKKINSDKDKRYEKAQQLLNDVTSTLSGINTQISQTKSDIQTLTPDSYNSDKQKFLTAATKTTSELNANQNTISDAYTKLNKLRSLLKQLKDQPTPTP